MAARTIELRNAIADRLLSVWGDPAPATVSVGWRIDVPDDSPSGRVVFVAPASYRSEGPVTRATDLNDYRYAVLVVERYTDAGDPTEEWLSERAAFVQESVYDVLQNVGLDRAENTAALLNSFWCETAEVTVVYDLEALTEHKLFWSEIEFTFREEA